MTETIQVTSTIIEPKNTNIPSTTSGTETLSFEDLQKIYDEYFNMTETIQVTSTTIKPNNANISGTASGTQITTPGFPEDLQKTFNTLSTKMRFYCNNLGSYGEKVALLEAVRDDRQKHRKKGSSIINLFCIIGVIILIINSLVSDKPDDDVNSYLSLFIEQIITRIMDLYWKMGFNKKFIIYTIYILIPPGLFSVVTIILITVRKFTPTSALAFVGPGVSLSEWVTEYLIEF